SRELCAARSTAKAIECDISVRSASASLELYSLKRHRRLVGGNMSKLHGFAIVAALVSTAAAAHHGFGRFDPSREVELEGTLTGVDFVNPHAYMYFEAVAEDGTVIPMRCEMRAATVLRRSGWSEEMFVNGSHVTIAGRPHRDDPASCYIETLTIGD